MQRGRAWKGSAESCGHCNLGLMVAKAAAEARKEEASGRTSPGGHCSLELRAGGLQLPRLYWSGCWTSFEKPSGRFADCGRMSCIEQRFRRDHLIVVN